jgi:hypothetical protein
MKAIMLQGNPDSGIIIQAAVPPYSLHEQIFKALCGAYRLTAVELPDWQYETVIREQWIAVKTATAAMLSPAVEDVQVIADSNRLSLQDSFPNSIPLNPDEPFDLEDHVTPVQ